MLPGALLLQCTRAGRHDHRCNGAGLSHIGGQASPGAAWCVPVPARLDVPSGSKQRHFNSLGCTLRVNQMKNAPSVMLVLGRLNGPLAEMLPVSNFVFMLTQRPSI